MQSPLLFFSLREKFVQLSHKIGHAQFYDEEEASLSEKKCERNI